MKYICEHALECRGRYTPCVHQVPHERTTPSPYCAEGDCLPDIGRYPIAHKDCLSSFDSPHPKRVVKARCVAEDELLYHAILEGMTRL